MADSSLLGKLRIDRTQREAPYLQLVLSLKRCIRDGALKPGERLPSLVDLAKASTLSRATVVRALAELSREGMVISKWGDGSYVGEAPQPTTEVVIHGSTSSPSAHLSRFFDQLIHGLRRGFPETDRSFPVSYITDRIPDAREYAAVLEARRADSLVLYRPGSDAEEAIREVAERIPAATLFRELSDSRAHAVVPDLRPVVRSVMEKRHAEGSRRFLFLARRKLMAEEPGSPYRQMAEAFAALAERMDIESETLIISHRDGEEASVRRAMERLESLEPNGTVFSHSSKILGDYGKPLESVVYTESEDTLERVRHRSVVLYLGIDRAAEAGAQLLARAQRNECAGETFRVGLAPRIIDTRDSGTRGTGSGS